MGAVGVVCAKPDDTNRPTTAALTHAPRHLLRIAWPRHFRYRVCGDHASLSRQDRYHTGKHLIYRSGGSFGGAFVATRFVPRWLVINQRSPAWDESSGYERA